MERSISQVVRAHIPNTYLDDAGTSVRKTSKGQRYPKPVSQEKKEQGTIATRRIGKADGRADGFDRDRKKDEEG